MGRKLELKIDHHGLKYLFEQQNLNARQERWLEFHCEFDFNIKHFKRKENKVTNALSRRMDVMHAITISTCKSDLKSRIIESLISYGYYLQVKLSYNKEMHNKGIRISGWKMMEFLCIERKFVFLILVR
jgi:hypothetical protein